MANKKKAVLDSPETRDEVTHIRLLNVDISFLSGWARVTYAKFTDSGEASGHNRFETGLPEAALEALEDVLLAQGISEEKVPGTKADI